MTAGHLLFTVVTTGYVLIAIRLEERDLVASFGDGYRVYRRSVPMLVPGLRPRSSRPVAHHGMPAGRTTMGAITPRSSRAG